MRWRQVGSGGQSEVEQVVVVKVEQVQVQEEKDQEGRGPIDDVQSEYPKVC